MVYLQQTAGGLDAPYGLSHKSAVLLSLLRTYM